VTQAALEAIKGEKSLVELARIYNVHPNTIVKWKAELMEKGATVFSNETQEKELEKKIRDLEAAHRQEGSRDRPPKKAEPTLRVTLGQGR
jgi:transposase-like protein